MIGPFLKAYPQVDLEIVSESGFVDIVSAGFDAGVRYGEHLAQDMVAISLSGPQSYVVVASPDYLARRGKPEHPKDLLDHNCIRARYSSGVMHDWEFEKAGQLVKVDPPAKLISTNMGLSMRAALDGAGIWATLDGYVGEALKSGALVSLIQDWCEPFPGPFLYYQAGDKRRRRCGPLSISLPTGASAKHAANRPHSMLGSTRSGGLCASRKVRMLMITFSPISTRPSIVAEPICGSNVTLPALASRTSFGFTAGSCS